MKNTILPVILLNNKALLPCNEIKLEFDDEKSKKMIDTSLLNHNNEILVVTPENYLEEEPTLEELPRIAIIATIKTRLVLPNGKTRVVLVGRVRANIKEYMMDEIISARIAELEDNFVEDEVNYAVGIKLKKELDNYIKIVPYMGNSVLNQIDSTKSLSVMTDIIVNNLPISIGRKIEYINCVEPLKRTEMILQDIYRDEESFAIDRKLDNLVKEEMDKNQKEYILKEKLQLIRAELGEANSRETEIIELKKRISKLQSSSKVKDKLNYELERYSSLPVSSSELGMIREYIECLLSLPWNNKTIEIDDLNSIKEGLDCSHYGLEDVKLRIIEYLAVKKVSNNIKSPIICLIGPPGVGKTTLAYSIAKSLNRKFARISVGGMSDEAEIRGHRRTYIGAYPGRIIESLKSVNSSNPVILIDEVDKMTKGSHGDPTSALLEVLDKSQNKYFHDNYLDIEFDISDVMFILTANDVDNIPLPLLDRLELIKLSEYTEYEKIDIAKNYIIPKICREYNLDNINIENNFLTTVIRDFTKESGVRELERVLTTVIRKIITKMVLTNDYSSKITLKNKDIDKHLGKSKFKNIMNNYNDIGVVSALSYTPYGGEVLPIEVNYYPGTGKLILTGSLGKITQESATIALSYIKANADKFDIDFKELVENDIHIHIPLGAINKDGPSAGVTLVTSIISAFKKINFSNSLALTGEITLRGKILPVGGIKEKCLGALKNSINTIIIPRANKSDLEELPNSIKKKLKFIYVDDYLDIYEYLMSIL